VVGWPKGRRGPVRRRSLGEVVNLNRWDEPAGGFAAASVNPTDVPPVI
jgi:hypothetical protein